MTDLQQKIKGWFSAKNIADISFILAIAVYGGCFLLLSWLGKELGFFEVMAVVIYGAMTVVGLCAVSAIARSVLLYKYPAQRTRVQKVLLAITAIPFWNLILKAFGAW
jgi:hypothetical protein